MPEIPGKETEFLGEICKEFNIYLIAQMVAKVPDLMPDRIFNVAFIIDGITSVGGLPVHPEQWGAEAVVVGAQKCTAGPSGIAAIAVNQHFIDRCNAIRNQGDSNSVYYLDILPALKKGDEVALSSGMLGKISGLDDNYLVLSVGNNVDLKFQKVHVTSVLPKGTLKSVGVESD